MKSLSCLLLATALLQVCLCHLANDDPGQPLFLTPLIQSGQLDVARQLSQVLPLPGSPPTGVGKSYSGYFTVNSKYNSNIFFWYFPAQVQEPKPGIPVLLWLQGGPGASSLFGLFAEHGPMFITKDMKLSLRDYAWTSLYHVVYIDQPVGTGFSFTDSDEGYVTDETQVAEDLYQALLQFFTLFSELQQNDFYITGESYAGKYVPAISYKIYKEQPETIRFRGLAIGNGLVDPINMINYGPYLYQLGLIDENQQQYFLAQQDTVKDLIRKRSYLQAYQVFNDLVLGINVKSSFQNYTGMEQHYNILHIKTPDDQNYYLNYVIQASARKAIHVGNKTFSDGNQVQRHLLLDFIQSTAPLLAELLEHYKVMIYSGQLDVIVAYPLTANFLQQLQWSGSEAYKNAERSIWKVDPADSEVAGYARQVGNFYQVLVRNAGHMVPYDQPRVGLDLIQRFVEGSSF